MGIFDRNLDQRVIMQVPEVYRYGIQNKWFGLKRFTWYMIDGIYAVNASAHIARIYKLIFSIAVGRLLLLPSIHVRYHLFL